MARKRRHHRLKPEVNPLTYIILGLVFITLTLTIIFSIDTKKQRLTKAFGLDKNNYVVSSFKKVEKKVNKNETILIVFNIIDENSPQPLLKELQSVYYKDETIYAYTKTKQDYKIDENNLSDLVKVIHYVELTKKESKAFNEFLIDHEVKNRINGPLMLLFENGELVSEYDGTETYPEYHATTQAQIEQNKLERNIVKFLENIKKDSE